MDDVATETQLSEGWAFVVLPTSRVSSLVQKVRVLGDGQAAYFHGKKFVIANGSLYESFLSAIREEAEAAAVSVLAFTLMDLSYKNEFLPFLEKTVEGAITSAGIADDNLLDQVQRLFPGIATLQRMLRATGAERVLELEIDRDAATKDFNASTFAKDGQQLPAELLLRAAYRAHRRLVPSGVPDIAEPGIRIVSDTKSLLVQAADVLGNFAMSYAFMRLGRPSKKIAEKGAIFERVFGDLLVNEDISAMARLVGSDLELLTPGAMTLHLSAPVP
jgi:hypothetical protein